MIAYPLSNEHGSSVESELARLRGVSRDYIFLFGYDGTTESCYCLEATSGNDEVYWFSWEEKIKRPFSTPFQKWIEAKPSELFNERTYAGYKTLTNVDKLVSVMEERAAFNVRLLGFDKQLQRPPNMPNDILPRYNRLILEVTKARPVTIQVLTIIVERLGSKIGAANVEYVSFSLEEIPVHVPTIRECYVFDPFNIPFTNRIRARRYCCGGDRSIEFPRIDRGHSALDGLGTNVMPNRDDAHLTAHFGEGVAANQWLGSRRGYIGRESAGSG